MMLSQLEKKWTTPSEGDNNKATFLIGNAFKTNLIHSVNRAIATAAHRQNSLLIKEQCLRAIEKFN